jgi:hypothetical protein
MAGDRMDGLMNPNYRECAPSKRTIHLGRVFKEIRSDKGLPWRDILVFGWHKASLAGVTGGRFSRIHAYLEVREAIEDGCEGKLLRDDGIDFELVWGCGLTVLENLIHPKDLTMMRGRPLPVYPDEQTF